MDAKEIVKALREHAEWAQANEWECPITLGDVLRKAADTIEELNDFQSSQCANLLAQLSELRAENARLRAERDKAVGDLKHITTMYGECYGCKRYDHAARKCTDAVSVKTCDTHGNNMYEWRGTEGKA
jgi:predicted nuclease with TOPRIM domain